MPPRLPIRLRSVGAVHNSAKHHVIRNVTLRRSFAVSSKKSTDGVFRELTNARVAVPWREALEKRDAGEKDKVDGTKEATAERDLTPKKSSDSYHSVVCH